MGSRRRKLLNRKFKALSWNIHNTSKALVQEKATEQKITKVVEDNSVMIERMNRVSSTCDEILHLIHELEIEEEEETTSEPQFMTIQPAPELGTTPKTNLSKMRKKELLELASDLGITLKSSTTKANIIKAIESV